MADVVKDIRLKDVVDIPPTPPPGPLSSFLATALSSSAVDLSWMDTGALATNYQIQVDTNSGFTNNTALTTISANPLSGGIYTVTGLSGTTAYFFRIRATNAAGNSAWVSTSTTTL